MTCPNAGADVPWRKEMKMEQSKPLDLIRLTRSGYIGVLLNNDALYLLGIYRTRN